MDFMESMICMMAVVIVLGLYLSFLSVSVAADQDQSDLFNPDLLDVRVKDGITIDESYLYMFLAETAYRGVSIDVFVPFFQEEHATFSVGSLQHEHTASEFMDILEYENGRKVPVIIRTVLYT